MISLTLPSLRKDAVEQRVKDWAITNGNIDYELIVVSPFEVKGENVVHISEKVPEGMIRAHRKAYESARGDYVCWLADDIIPTKNCLTKMLEFTETHEDMPFIGGFRRFKYAQDDAMLNPWSGAGIEYNLWSAYGKVYVQAGFASRATIEKIGGYLDIVFKGFWADADICLRAIAKGGRVEYCRNAFTIHRNIEDALAKKNMSANHADDAETFIARWHPRFGKGLERNIDVVHKECKLTLPVVRLGDM